MIVESELAWACVATQYSDKPWLNEYSVRARRADSQERLGNAWRKEGETIQQGWRRAYRKGWRCIRVKVSAL